MMLTEKYTQEELDEITALKRQLALSYTENAALRRETLSDEETGAQAPEIMEQQTPEVKQEFESVRETIAIGQEAALLEQSGIPYSIALKISEAVHVDDFEAAGKLMDLYEEQQRTTNAAEIAEAEEQARLRRIFGLR